MKILIFVLLLITFLIGSCYYDSNESLYPQVAAACDTSNVTYSASVTRILNSNCMVCHSNSQAGSLGGNIKLENFADVKTYATNGRLYGAIAHLNGYSPMPKGASKLSNCEITTIKKWIDTGAPNN